MFHRHAIFIALGVALAGGPAAAQNVDALIAARAGDAALKACLDRAPAVAGYRSAAQAAAKARDPKTPAKFNCSGIGASWQEVAPKACCAAFERDKGKNVDAAWAALQVCGWQAKTVERRPAYEAAARQCLAQTAAPSPPAPQQAQKPQTAVPFPQQQAQRPQPTPPSAPSHEAQRAPTRPTPAWPEPGWPTPAPSYPPYGGSTEQGQVPLTPPPPLAPLAPAAPQQQAQVPLTPPPPIPPPGPEQETQKTAEQKKRFFRAIEESLGITPGMLEMVDRVKGNAGYVAYPGPDGSPWVVDTFGVSKPMPDWIAQRMMREQTYILADRRIVSQVFSNLDIGQETMTFLWTDDPRTMFSATERHENQNWKSIPQDHLGRKAYLAVAAVGVDAKDRLLSNRALATPKPPPGVDVKLYYYLKRRAFAHSWEEEATVPTPWELLQRINGGGDFIERQPLPGETTPMLHAGGRWRDPASTSMATLASAGPAERPSGRLSQIELVSASANVRDFGGMIEVSAAGVTVIAVTHGSVMMREHATGATRTAGAGSYIAAVPGIGVTSGPLPDDLRARVATDLKNLPPVPPRSRQIAQAPSVRVSEATPARGVKDGKPVEPGAVFAPDTNPIYVWFRPEGLKAGVVLRSTWRYLSGDKIIGEGDLDVPANASWGAFHYELAPGKRWPVGDYRVDVRAGDRPLASVSFRVAEAGAQPRIVEARAAHGVSEGKPVRPTDSFAPEDKEIFVWFRVAGIKEPTKLRAIWTYVGAAGEQFIVESAATLRPENDWGDMRVEGPPGRPWPVGNYRVDFLFGDTKVASVPFRVAGAAQPAIVAAKAARGVRNGEPVGMTEVFAPDAGKIYVWFRMAGHNAPTVLRGVWHYLGEGKDQVLISSEMIIQANEDWGDFEVELPPGKPWPLGEYRLDILLNGKVAAFVPFRVQAPAAKPVPAKPIAEAVPKIIEAKAARGVKENGLPVGMTEVFAPDVGRLYVWFRIAGHDRPVKLLSEWHYLGTGRDELLADIEMTGQPGKDGGHFQLELLPGRLWPLGAYRVDIIMDGKVAASVPFRVEAAAPKVTISQAQAARGVKDGKPVDPGTAFAPDTSPLYVWFRIAGNTEPVKVRGEWRYLGGGGDRIVSKAEGEIKAGSTSANFRRTLAEGKTWAVGDYRLDIFVADALTASVPFRIEEASPKPAGQSAAPAAAGITLAGVEALLRELGVEPQLKTRQDGLPYFEFMMDGRKTALGLYGCTPGPCTQALLYAGFKTDRKIAVQAINDWNREQRFVRAYLDAGGDPVVESDLVVAGAQTATLREWIAAWRQRVPQFVALLTK